MLGSFGYRMLAGYQRQDYMRLVGGGSYIRAQKPRGRFLLASGDDPEFVQLALGEDDELRRWALKSAPLMPSDVGKGTSPVSLREAVKPGHPARLCGRR